MTFLNLSLPRSLKDFVDTQVRQRGYGTRGEYVRELLRKERERIRLRKLILRGARSPLTGLADSAFFVSLHKRIRRRSE